jgi:hypothetical protein
MLWHRRGWQHAVSRAASRFDRRTLSGMGNGPIGGFIAMNTDDLGDHAELLRLTGVALSEDYRPPRNRIDAGLGAIGTGEALSAAFRQTHDAVAHQNRGEAERLIGVYATLSAAGKDSATGYLGANDNARRGMPRPI